MDNSESILEKFRAKYHLNIGKLLGKGGFGEVREITTTKGKVFAGKLVKKKQRRERINENNNENEEKEEENIILYLKNPNIVKIYKIYEEIYNNKGKIEKYNFIIMEKAVLKDLKTFNHSIYSQTMDNFIYIPFKETIGDNLLQFLCRQIVKGLELFERNEFIHFDIKPENILIFLEFYLKITDFGLLKDVSNGKNLRIPGGTPGYLSPEYYKDYKQKISVDIAKKQDYFALGATIFLLKYGKQMLRLKIRRTNKSEENKLSQEYIVDMLQKRLLFIKADKIADRDFVNFLCSLIQIIPEERPKFEEIYRNKWLNKNVDEISKIFQGFRNDEQKLIIELRKNDYLSEKEKDLKKNRKKFIFKNKKENKNK